MSITRDTTICCSFSKSKGKFGVRFFNHAFRAAGLDWVYLPFAINEIIYGLMAMDTLDIRGAGVSMPFKVDVLRYVTEASVEAERIQAANTIVRTQQGVVAHNTDWRAARTLLGRAGRKKVVVLGNGGYSRAVVFAAQTLGMDARAITRNTWDEIADLRDELVFNCTPVENISVHPSCEFIDCIVGTKTGDELAYLQACEQFKLYTGTDVPQETRSLYEGNREDGHQAVGEGSLAGT